MHHVDTFRKEFQQFSPLGLGTPSLQQTTDFADWLRSDGIQLFKDAFHQETNQPVPTLPNDKLIEQAYPKNLNEIEKKQGQQAFYASNAQIFADTCCWIASIVAMAGSDPRAEPFASRHHALLHRMTLDALALLADWAALTQGTPAMYGIGKNSWHSAFQISHATEQLMFAGSPFFTFADNATDSGTALLRVALETRIRFGFGLLGVLDVSSQTVLPLNMSTILTAIGHHESRFQLAVPLQHIERIYGWSNIYVHVGLKHFTWSPIFALRYLNPLLRGGKCPGGASVNAGIYIDKATLIAIQNEAESACKIDPTKHKLVSITPEHCSVVLKP